jgi:threonine aldolase
MRGIPVPKSYIDAVGEIAQAHELAIHIDGARLFNAVTALRCDAADLVAAADSVTFCLSKGLCAPVGSVLVGSEEFIVRARRMRKILGGGMRQAGILAAAGLIALETMTKRLDEDHANARRLADGLAKIPCIEFNPAEVHTNIVYFRFSDKAPKNAIELAEALLAHHIKALWMGPRYMRLVTHHGITADDIDRVLDVFQKELL